MPLVQSQGIYCFYSTALIEALAGLIDRRSCLEIAAGDGTLASLLTETGVPVTATDDFSWTHVIQYPDRVEELGAREALEKYQPQVVLCSWPPPGNPFEKRGFFNPQRGALRSHRQPLSVCRRKLGGVYQHSSALSGRRTRG